MENAKNKESESLSDFQNRCKIFLDSFIPDPKKCFVSGGFFPRFYHQLPIRDIDIYVNDDEAFAVFEKEYQNVGYYLLTQKRNFSQFIEPTSCLRIDLIGFHGLKTPSYLCRFDFTICRMYYQNGIVNAYGSKYDFQDVIKKQIRWTGSVMHTSGQNNILTRLKKYLDLGFSISNSELTQIYQFLTSEEVRKEMLEDSYAQ